MQNLEKTRLQSRNSRASLPFLITSTTVGFTVNAIAAIYDCVDISNNPLYNQKGIR